MSQTTIKSSNPIQQEQNLSTISGVDPVIDLTSGDIFYWEFVAESTVTFSTTDFPDGHLVTLIILNSAPGEGIAFSDTLVDTGITFAPFTDIAAILRITLQAGQLYAWGAALS